MHAYSGAMQQSEQRKGSRADWATLGLFGVASLATVAIGAIGLALNGSGGGSSLRNPAAWLAGLVLAGLIQAVGRSAATSRVAIALSLAGLAATLFSTPQSGVYRWIDVGPLHINIAALLLPLALVALATARLPALYFLGTAAAIGLELVAQPDASQATAFLVAAGFLLQRSHLSSTAKIGGTLGIAALTILAWLQPDRLQPVSEVEGIFRLLVDVSPALAALAAVGLAISSLIPLRRAVTGGGNTAEAAKALALYCALVAILPAIGAYPVPLVGLGMSFPVGHWMGVAFLCARDQRTP